jgi:hypothetical protein
MFYYGPVYVKSMVDKGILGVVFHPTLLLSLVRIISPNSILLFILKLLFRRTSKGKLGNIQKVFLPYIAGWEEHFYED